MTDLRVPDVARALLGEPKRHQGRTILYLCPRHDDTEPSLTIDEGKDIWSCFPCDVHGRSWKLVQWCLNCGKDEAAAWLRDHGFLEERMKPAQRKEVAVYSYQDEKENLLYQVVRYEPKSFAYRRPSTIGKWVWNLQGTRRVLYGLPRVMASDTVFVLEGEKDCDALSKWGYVATTCPMGAGKWLADYNPSLAGKHVYIVPDNDSAGKIHAEQVAQSVGPTAASVSLIELPGLPEKGDFSDWVKVGGTKGQFQDLIEGAAPFISGTVSVGINSWRDIPTMGCVPNVQVEWLIEGFLPQAALIILAGESRSLKTWVSMDIAGRVSNGIKFAGRPVIHRRTLVLDRENPASVIHYRRDLLGIGDPRQLHYWGIWQDEQPPDPTDERLLAMAKEEKPLMIFDSLIRFHRGKENSSEEMALTMGKFRALVAAGATVLILHHRSDKMGSDVYRGSSEILAACDVMYAMDRDQQDRNVVGIMGMKNRFSEESDFAVRLQPGGFLPIEMPERGTNLRLIRGGQ